MDTTLFQTLTQDEKIEFFLQGQKLLVDYHPKSPFVFRENNIKERLTHIKSLVSDYKGLCFWDNTICILFNKIIVVDPQDPVSALRDYKFKKPTDNYNAVSIDFVVFKELKDCAAWVKAQYDPRIRYVIYVKNGKPQLYKTEHLIARVFQMPLSVPQLG